VGRVKTMALLGVLACLIVGAVALISSAGSGSGPGAGLDPIARAADATTSAGSAEMTMNMTVNAAGQTIAISGSGVEDPQHLRADLTMLLNVPGLGDTSIEEIMAGTVLYMKMPSRLASQVPGGKPWFKLDLQEFGKKTGIDFAKAMQQDSANRANPAEMLRYLKAVGNSSTVGTETIRGLPTTHYHGSIDLNKAFERIGDKHTAEALRQMVSAAGNLQDIPVDVWIDKSGLVRRETFAVNGTADNEPFSMNVTIDYIRFGVKVNVLPPPDDQVFDMTSLASGALQQGG
jgi:hypothetical protein